MTNELREKIIEWLDDNFIYETHCDLSDKELISSIENHIAGGLEAFKMYNGR